MKIQPAENIREYIENEKTVPLVSVKGVLWYAITPDEKRSLLQFIRELDAIPSNEWQALPESEKLALSCAWCDANRIYNNSILREN